MDKKEARQLKKDEKLRRKYEKVSNGNKFKQWRKRRHFWGATLTVLAALLILYIPLHLYAISFIPGSLVFVGFLFGGLILISGIFSFIYPQFSTVLGVVTMFISVLSIMGALGGFIFGTILGLIAGALCIGWEQQEVTVESDKPNQKNKREDRHKKTPKKKEAETAQA